MTSNSTGFVRLACFYLIKYVNHFIQIDKSIPDGNIEYVCFFFTYKINYLVIQADMECCGAVVENITGNSVSYEFRPLNMPEPTQL